MANANNKVNNYVFNPENPLQVSQGGTSISRYHGAISFFNARVAGKAFFRPPYYSGGTYKSGSRKGQRIMAPATTRVTFYVANSENGGETREFVFTGLYAMRALINLNIGASADIVATPEHYKTQLKYEGQLYQTPSGAPLMIEKVQYNVEFFSPGSDSNKFVMEQIAEGKRPPCWNMLGHSDYDRWQQQMEERRATRYVIGSEVKELLWANVWTPPGKEIALVEGITSQEPVNNSSQGEKTIEGFTYKELKEAGWTDDEIRTSQYAPLLPKKAPLPPSQQKKAPLPPSKVTPKVATIDGIEYTVEDLMNDCGWTMDDIANDSRTKHLVEVEQKPTPNSAPKPQPKKAPLPPRKAPEASDPVGDSLGV